MFKLYAKRKSYNALRSVVVTVTGEKIATFDEFGMGADICDIQLCGLTSDMILSVLASPSGSSSSSMAPRWPDGATEDLYQGEQRQQQQQNQGDVDAPSRVASESGLGLGVVARTGRTAVGPGPRCGSTRASVLGLVGGQLGDGRGWAGQRDEESLGGTLASETVLKRQAGSGRRGSGIGSMSGHLLLTSHQPDERDRQCAPFCSGGGVGPGAGPFVPEAAARHQQLLLQQQHRQNTQAQQREPRRRGISAAGQLCLAPDDHQQQLLRRVVSEDGANTGYASHDLGQVELPLVEYRNGMQPGSYGGGQEGGPGVDGGDEAGTPVYSSDLAGLLLDDALG